MIVKTILWQVGEVNKHGKVMTEEALRVAADKLPGGNFDEASKCLMFEGKIAPVLQDGKIVSADFVAESAVSMGGDSIYNSVVKLAADKFNVVPSKIKGSSSFREDLGFDSLDEVEFIMQVEDMFKIEITDEEAELLTTVGKVCEYLKGRV